MPVKPKQKRAYVRKKILPKKIRCPGCRLEYRKKNKDTHEKNISHIKLTQKYIWNAIFES